MYFLIHLICDTLIFRFITVIRILSWYIKYYLSSKSLTKGFSSISVLISSMIITVIFSGWWIVKCCVQVKLINNK